MDEEGLQFKPKKGRPGVTPTNAAQCEFILCSQLIPFSKGAAQPGDLFPFSFYPYGGVPGVLRLPGQRPGPHYPFFGCLMCFLPNVSVAGGGERLPSGKHILPLPLEGVCQRPRSPVLRARRLWPGETAFRRFPHQRP